MMLTQNIIEKVDTIRVRFLKLYFHFSNIKNCERNNSLQKLQLLSSWISRPLLFQEDQSDLNNEYVDLLKKEKTAEDVGRKKRTMNDSEKQKPPQYREMLKFL